ncbi:hypothetical protein [Mumia zhuanghuii]|uniref:Uncharacterized protein n=1 Tax=Mumia zhuanghuii TaxID=2585211 RepID=A0A5C4MJS0_9ACTN|nr:hypothetical protein [Mumia zhuanghuii]TNC44232.1 hypothetical protein FHE65_16965 [Mumia zhuanghuii]TNC52158.1 hypothetical protein FHE65_00850 [Mumia zhuanghuii]
MASISFELFQGGLEIGGAIALAFGLASGAGVFFVSAVRAGDGRRVPSRARDRRGIRRSGRRVRGRRRLAAFS